MVAATSASVLQQWPEICRSLGSSASFLFSATWAGNNSNERQASLEFSSETFFHALCLAFICFWFACCVGWGGIVVAGPHNSSGSNNRSLFNWSAPLLCSSLCFLFYLLFLFFLFVSWILSGLFFFPFPLQFVATETRPSNNLIVILLKRIKADFLWATVSLLQPLSYLESIIKHTFTLFSHVVADSSRNTHQNRGTALAAGFGRVEVFDIKPWQFQSPRVVNCPSLICYRFN